MHMYAFVKTHQTIHSKCVHYVNYANHISIFLFKGALLPKPSKNKFQRPDDLGTHLEFFLCLHIVSRSQIFFLMAAPTGQRLNLSHGCGNTAYLIHRTGWGSNLLSAGTELLQSDA